MDAVFKALADPTRRKLLDRLHAKGGLTLAQLCVRIGMSRQAVTQHLDVLESASLVSVTWRGREKLHFLNPVPLHSIYSRWVRKFEGRRLDALAELKKSLEGADDGQANVRLRHLHRVNAGASVGRSHQTRVHKKVLGS